MIQWLMMYDDYMWTVHVLYMLYLQLDNYKDTENDFANVWLVLQKPSSVQLRKM